MSNPKQYKVPQAFLDNIVSPSCKGDAAILEAFQKVPREFFVDEAMRLKAYTDNALPIGFGQTISQPSLVAMMLHELEVTKKHKCMEIGAGSGFATTLLGVLSDEVYGLELIPEIYRKSHTKVRQFMFNNVKMLLSDGSWGYKDKAPYDRILVSAGAASIPQTLLEQLSSNNGVMVIPYNDILTKIVKNGDKIEQKQLAKVAFVDFVGT